VRGVNSGAAVSERDSKQTRRNVSSRHGTEIGVPSVGRLEAIDSGMTSTTAPFGISKRYPVTGSTWQ
jgi:hypothetical protein